MSKNCSGLIIGGNEGSAGREKNRAIHVLLLAYLNIRGNLCRPPCLQLASSPKMRAFSQTEKFTEAVIRSHDGTTQAQHTWKLMQGSLGLHWGAHQLLEGEKLPGTSGITL